MKIEEYPQFENDEQADEWFDRDEIGFVDHNPYDTLESVDRILQIYGLEVVYFGDDPECPFTIRPFEGLIN